MDEAQCLSNGKAPNARRAATLTTFALITTVICACNTTNLMELPNTQDVEPTEFGCPSIGSDYGSWTDLSGNERSTRHMGVDIAAPRGTPILSAAPGFVIYVDESTRGGKVVRIDHGKNNKTGENVFTSYAHLRRYGKGPKGKRLQYGYEIPRGHVVGYVGLTGETFEAHLHFQVNVNQSGVAGVNKHGNLIWSDPVNPQPYWWQQNPGENKIHSYMVSMNYGDTGSSGFMGLTFPLPCNKK